MPPKRTFVAAAVSSVAAAAAPKTTAVVEKLGTVGVAVLSQWFEKMESVFHISNCAV
ncbi:hypothetical protein Tco_0486158, partial [Tanacetum coccineum]